MAREVVSFTTFNLYNLNLPDRSMYRKDTVWTADQVMLKVAWTRAMLGRATADIVGFQELWHPDPLREAMAGSALADSHDLILPADLDGQGIACAAMVRRGALVSAEWITTFPEAFRLQSKGEDKQTSEISVTVNTFSRPVLHLVVRLRPERPDIHVFVCHLKSKAPTALYRDAWYKAAPDLYKPHAAALGMAVSTIRRTAEATALRIILNGVMKKTETPVVVLGDLNDGQDSNTIDIISEQPTFLEPLAKGGGDTALYSGQGLQQLRDLRDVYYTYVFNKQHGSLDHILVSREFYDQSRTRLWKFDGLDIFNDHLNDGGAEKPFGAGDHGVVRARFSYKP